MPEGLRGTTCFDYEAHGRRIHVWQAPTTKGDPCLCGEAEALWDREPIRWCTSTGPCGGVCNGRDGHGGLHCCCQDHEWEDSPDA